MKKHMKYVALGLLFVYIIVMIIGFLITVPKNLDVVNDYDKLIHFAEFFVLTLLTLWTFSLFKIKHYYIFGLLLCLVFVVLTEYLQTLVPRRTFSYYDMLADLVGVIVGVLAYKILFSNRP